MSSAGRSPAATRRRASRPAAIAYRGGRLCFRFEEPLHRFQNMVIDKMVGIDRVLGGDEGVMTRMFPDP